MLEELLRLLQDGNTHNVLELSETLGDDAEGILSKLDFLEKQGYIRKVSLADNCDHHCIGCHGCNQVAPNSLMWEVIKR